MDEERTVLRLFKPFPTMKDAIKELTRMEDSAAIRRRKWRIGGYVFTDEEKIVCFVSLLYEWCEDTRQKLEKIYWIADKQGEMKLRMLCNDLLDVLPCKEKKDNT